MLPNAATDGEGADFSVPQVARKILVAFVLTFTAARILVRLLMSRRVPDLYMHLG